MRFLLGLALICAAEGAHAADITVLSTRELSYDEVTRGACTLRLEGEIVRGDAERLKTVLERDFPLAHDETGPSLCLDSPGGSLDEGVAIAQLLGAHFTSTVLEPEASCLSACAVAFMGGTFGWFEYRYNMRVMHPSAKLGFHAPALVVGEGSYDAPTVVKAFDVAIDAVARIAGDLDVVHLGGQVNRFPRSLLAQMLRHRGEDYLWIDTVEKAGAWAITMNSIDGPDLTSERLVVACKSAERWLEDKPTMNFPPRDRDWSFDTHHTQSERLQDGALEVRFGELFEWVCRGTPVEGGSVTVKVTRDGSEIGQILLAPWALYPPDTALSDLR